MHKMGDRVTPAPGVQGRGGRASLGAAKKPRSLSAAQLGLLSVHDCGPVRGRRCLVDNRHGVTRDRRSMRPGPGTWLQAWRRPRTAAVRAEAFRRPCRPTEVRVTTPLGDGCASDNLRLGERHYDPPYRSS